MHTSGTFLAAFPEFTQADAGTLAYCLGEAAKRIDPDVWGSLSLQGHGLLTAHLLSLSPNGQFARLESDKNQTIYGVQHAELVAQVACAIRVF